MSNSMEKAKHWLELILKQDLPARDVFVSHVLAGTIDTLCDCGCHGFGFEIPQNRKLPALTKSSDLYCEIAFESNKEEEIAILLFTDDRGYFSGTDVMYGPNVEPMPDGIQVGKIKGVWPSEGFVNA